jgi:hypothetical protein
MGFGDPLSWGCIFDGVEAPCGMVQNMMDHGAGNQVIPGETDRNGNPLPKKPVKPPYDPGPKSTPNVSFKENGEKGGAKSEALKLAMIPSAILKAAGEIPLKLNANDPNVYGPTNGISYVNIVDHDGNPDPSMNPTLTSMPESSSSASDCSGIKQDLLGDITNRRALNDAWTRSRYGDRFNNTEVGGLLGRSMSNFRGKTFYANAQFPGRPGSLRHVLQGFTRWAQDEIANAGEGNEYHYWFHSHPFDDGAIVDAEQMGDPSGPSNRDAQVSRILHLNGVLITKDLILVFDGSGRIKCKFNR